MTLTKKAVIARINRKLAHQYEMLRTTRGSRAYADFGDHYVVSAYGGIVDRHVDVEELGRELGVLREHDQLAT